MNKYIAKWGFIDRSGNDVRAGDRVEYGPDYGDVLKAKGLIADAPTQAEDAKPKAQGKKTAPENKADPKAAKAENK